MRLIDVDEAIKQFDPNTWQGEMLITILKGLPTAYDVDEVVEELNKSSDHYECDNLPNGTDSQMVFLEDAIEIVKRGGIS